MIQILTIYPAYSLYLLSILDPFFISRVEYFPEFWSLPQCLVILIIGSLKLEPSFCIWNPLRAVLHSVSRQVFQELRWVLIELCMEHCLCDYAAKRPSKKPWQ